ncbi:AraC family transcriptional regulator ligand-binding domain-containing protein [Tistrella mobilis]|uniref:AraC family transcriptional regulator n=1 Tax=Tistrella mobilis TaxID=171437 RepID=UPI0035572E24
MQTDAGDTLSTGFVHGLLEAAAGITTPDRLRGFVAAAGIAPDLLDAPAARVTRDQMVALYQQVAIGTGDEMMGLWSRRIRTGSLKLLCTAMLDAPSILTALYRFTRVWNLLLDDWRLDCRRLGETIEVTLERAADDALIRPFGHALMMKLHHGVTSWLAGRETPVTGVDFAFPAPAHAADHALLFPCPVRFDAPVTRLCMPAAIGRENFRRSRQEMLPFLHAAPRQWLFTTLREPQMADRVRDELARHLSGPADLAAVAAALGQSTRSLSRRLAEEGTSFRAVKEALRRDIAIRDLTRTDRPIAAIAAALGFDSAAVFHRAFKSWTGSTPGAYRQPGGWAAGGESSAPTSRRGTRAGS